MPCIDLNCDCGEHTAPDIDQALMPLITSANIACGGHAGDEASMRATVRLAKRYGVAVGAHPSFPDRANFGRDLLPLSPDAIRQTVFDQVTTLAAVAAAEGVRLRHVKPHGALYNHAAHDMAAATAIAEAVAHLDKNLILVGLAGSLLLDAGRAAGVLVAAEAFADRAYETDGSLRSRRLPGAMIEGNAASAAQAVQIVTAGTVQTFGGGVIPVVAQTICLHGDTPGAASRAQALRDGLLAAGVTIQALCASTVA